jgi:hypothetical protein
MHSIIVRVERPVSQRLCRMLGKAEVIDRKLNGSHGGTPLVFDASA